MIYRYMSYCISSASATHPPKKLKIKGASPEKSPRTMQCQYILCLRAKDMYVITFDVTAAGRVYWQRSRFEYLGETISGDSDGGVEIARHVQRACARPRWYSLELYGRSSVPPKLPEGADAQIRSLSIRSCWDSRVWVCDMEPEQESLRHTMASPPPL